ncbi:hypothetical protein FRB99_004796 [Tulasnella sp. 403]|nr:hypothetical protein FRB99_004796 [Tulasnella sp. 403]
MSLSLSHQCLRKTLYFFCPKQGHWADEHCIRRLFPSGDILHIFRHTSKKGLVHFFVVFATESLAQDARDDYYHDWAVCYLQSHSLENRFRDLLEYHLGHNPQLVSQNDPTPQPDTSSPAFNYTARQGPSKLWLSGCVIDVAYAHPASTAFSVPTNNTPQPGSEGIPTPAQKHPRPAEEVSSPAKRMKTVDGTAVPVSAAAGSAGPAVAKAANPPPIVAPVVAQTRATTTPKATPTPLQDHAAELKEIVSQVARLQQVETDLRKQLESERTKCTESKAQLEQTKQEQLQLEKKHQNALEVEVGKRTALEEQICTLTIELENSKLAADESDSLHLKRLQELQSELEKERSLRVALQKDLDKVTAETTEREASMKAFSGAYEELQRIVKVAVERHNSRFHS